MFKAKNKIVRDLFLILFLFGALFAFVFLFSSVLRQKPTGAQRQERITVAVEDIPYELLRELEIGERVLDRTHRAILGRIESLRVEPHTYERAADGESVIVNKEGYCDAFFTVRLDGAQGGSYFVGEGIAISTPTFAGEGRVFSIGAEGEE